MQWRRSPNSRLQTQYKLYTMLFDEGKPSSEGKGDRKPNLTFLSHSGEAHKLPLSCTGLSITGSLRSHLDRSVPCAKNLAPSSSWGPNSFSFTKGL
ncbi:hypothetical protein ACTXT7_001137 [Hymenolepis weldensis]